MATLEFLGKGMSAEEAVEKATQFEVMRQRVTKEKDNQLDAVLSSSITMASKIVGDDSAMATNFNVMQAEKGVKHT